MGHNKKDTLVAWLNDAYAMEEGIEEVLERQIGQMDKMPDARERVRQHLELTRVHADRVKACVERLGEKVSHTKSAFANMLGTMQGMSTAVAEDKVLKDALANYAIENFEIASYTSLSAAAKDVGEDEIARVCDGIRREEEEMASWIEKQIPMLTQKELQAMAV
jgi:ferritin-like metal-binding protein YciE